MDLAHSAREYHLKQANARPNVIQTILGGIALCQPPLNLPPQLIKYVAKTYGTWYVSLEMLDSLQLGLATTDGAAMYKDVERIKSTTYDATAELYQLLSEHDFFFGLWRRRCVFPETNAALSCEQIGMWQRAQSMYEGVQLKARGIIVGGYVQ